MSPKRSERRALQFERPMPGDWIRPVPRGYKAACCDCGLVHKIDFRVHEGRAEFRVFAAPRLTDAFRRGGHGIFENLLRFFNAYPAVKIRAEVKD